MGLKTTPQSTMDDNDKSSTTSLMIFLQLYESFWLYSNTLEWVFQNTNELEIWKNGSYMTSLMARKTFQGTSYCLKPHIKL